MTRFARIATEGSQRAGTAWRTISAQPSWITRATIVAFIIVIGVLLLAALLAASVVFAVLYCVNQIIGLFRGLLPRGDGRENVRVIRRSGLEE